MTTNKQLLLIQNVMWLRVCWKALLNLSYDGLALTPHPFISRMEEQPTPHETAWLLFVKCSELFISRFGDIAWPARSPDLTVQHFFLLGWGVVPERPCVPGAYHDYSRTRTSHCWRSCCYWWGPTEVRVRQLPDMLATMHWCKRRPSAWCNFQ